MSAALEELRPGIHRWTARHPDWHPADAFGAEVASYALAADDTLLLIDPQLPDDAPDLLDDLAAEASSVAILITIGYHVRSTAALAARYGATAYGPEPARRRLPEVIRPLEDGPLPAGVSAHAIGRPRRKETPLWLPSHRAVVFGDAVVTTPEGVLRMWCQEPVTAERERFYAERFAPTLQPLIDREPLHILVTHGCPQMDEGGDALAKCAAKPPWFHRS